MGHLGNPISFRLSYRKVWDNKWFIKNLYYPEFINSMINVKDFIYYYLSRRFSLYSGLSLSHFFLYKFYKIYIFKIYIYHIDLEKNTVNVLNQIFETYYTFLFSKTWGQLKQKGGKVDRVFQVLHNADVFSFLFLCFMYFSKNKKKLYFIKHYKLLKKRLDFFLYVKKTFKFLKYLILNIVFFKNNIFKSKYNKFKYRSYRKYVRRLKKEFLIFIKYLKTKKIKLEKNSELYLNIKAIKELWKENFNFSKKLKKMLKCVKQGLFVLRRNRLRRFWLDKRIKTQKFDFSLIFFVLYLLKKSRFRRFKMFQKFGKKWKKTLKHLKIFKFIEKNNLYILNGLKFVMAFFIMIYKAKSYYTKRRYNFRSSIYYFLYNLLYVKIVKKIMLLYFKLLKYYLYIINSRIKNIIFNIYFISNNTVSAYFICKYLGLRLRRNFNLKKVVFTIKRQLCKLMWFNKRNTAYRLYNYKAIINLHLKKVKIWFIKIFLFFWFLLKNKIYKLYKVHDFLGIFYVYFYQKLIKLNIKKIMLYNLMVEIFDLFYLFKNKNFFKISFYVVDLNIIYNKFINLFFFKNALIYKKKFNNVVFSLNSFFFKNYINFVYLKFMLFNRLKINLRNLRRDYYPKYKTKLMGFKLAFRGRFSRKQRASKVWIQQGKVPLNTLKANIDFALYTIPLKNSLISVKLWLYRNANLYWRYKKFIQI